MDALEFAKRGIDELNSRLGQIGNLPDAASPNFKMTPEEVVARFFSDQGLTFQNMDVKKVLALTQTKPMPAASVQEQAPDEE